MKMKGVDNMAVKEASWGFQCLGYHIAPPSYLCSPHPQSTPVFTVHAGELNMWNVLLTVIQAHFYKPREFSKSTATAQRKNMGYDYENTDPLKQKVSTFKKLITKNVMTTSFSHILITAHENSSI